MRDLTAREVAQAFAPSFEPPPAQHVVAQLEQRCEQLRAEVDRLTHKNGNLKEQLELEGQQEITEHIAKALTAKALAAEGLAASASELQERLAIEMRRCEELEAQAAADLAAKQGAAGCPFQPQAAN